MKSQPFYLKKIREDFERRTRLRKGFSLRAYARLLGVEAPSLSKILKGQRQIPKNKVRAVVDKLNLSPREQNQFLLSNERAAKRISLAKEDRYQLSSELHFNIIAEWEHYAVLSLIETEGFQYDFEWISKRLNISALRAQICIENLIQSGLLCLKEGNLALTNGFFSTTEDIPSAALRKARHQDLEGAARSIDEVSVALRDLSACTMTLNPENLSKLKEFIRNFRKQFMKQAESEPGLEVYKLAIQLYPLTALESDYERI